MSNNVASVINELCEETLKETPVTGAGKTGHGNCSGNGNQGCCGSHRQENSAHHNGQTAKSCCGH